METSYFMSISFHPCRCGDKMTMQKEEKGSGSTFVCREYPQCTPHFPPPEGWKASCPNCGEKSETKTCTTCGADCTRYVFPAT